MEKLELLERAIAIASEAHKHQKDRYGAPYILHPLRVMGRVSTPKEKILAVLHDIVEDTDWTVEKLKKEGFPEDVLEALDCVTKREGEDYDVFVKRSQSNALATRVKIADLEDNMDIRRMRKVTEKDASRLNKYLQAWHRLNNK